MRSSKVWKKAAVISAAAAAAAALSVAVTNVVSYASSAPAAAPTCTAGTTVRIADGPVCGVTANGVTSYHGIPYAAPPTGDLRWAPPAPPTPWTSTLTATTDGNICPALPNSGPPAVGNEDCLNLNVQTPATKSDRPLPVMFEIHGGGFLRTAFNALPDATPMVATQHVVYVAVNYRLGILGFLAHAAFGAHSGDYGLQDQQAALRWVQRNIARFGGDPHNVTIFGQSAGGASVCDAAVSPTARGLFQRGISQSGFYNSAVGPNQVWAPGDCKVQLPTEAQAQQAGAAFASKVGCTDSAAVAACLRATPAEKLLEDAGQLLDPAAGGTIAPTINGTTLPMSPGKAFATGHVNDVSLMIGVSRDEFNGGSGAASVIATTPAQYRSLVRQKYGSLAPTVFALYPLARFPGSSPFIAFRTIVADADSVCPALVADRELSRHIPVFAYEEDDADTSPYLDPSLPWGALHVAEGGYVPSPSPNLSADENALAQQVMAEWTGYARTGNPTVPGAPRWTRYSKANPDLMSLVPAGDSALDPASTISMQHNCGFWNAVTPKPHR